MPFTFLTAEWRKLIMAQYEVPHALLEPRLPQGLELDLYEGRAFVSLVGFLFDRVRIFGVPLPFHTRFEEVNLRFYVRRPMPDGSARRGVVFLSEIVPRPAITLVARALYGEAYSTAPTSHSWGTIGSDPYAKPPGGGRRKARKHLLALQQSVPGVPHDAVPWRRPEFQVDYEWKHRQRWQRLGVRSENCLETIAPGSMEEFITEHYWGYTRTRHGGTAEYGVEHSRWKVYPVRQYRIACNFGSLYGPEFTSLEQRAPDHVLLAEGAPVRIRWGGNIT